MTVSAAMPHADAALFDFDVMTAVLTVVSVQPDLCAH